MNRRGWTGWTGVLGLLAALLALPAPAAPQGARFELSGLVTDDGGLPLAGVRLTLTHEATGLVRTVETDADGRYVFPAMPPGVYLLEVARTGYATKRYAGLRYFADTKPILDVVLRSRAVEQSMTVTGEAPLVNVSQSQIGLSIDERQNAELPTADRDFLDLVVLAPGTVDASPSRIDAPAAAKPVALNGADPRTTRYLLDGIDNGRREHGVVRLDPPFDAVDEFRVVASPFSAELGRTAAGLVSVVTRSGSNDLGGTAFFDWLPEGRAADDPRTGLAAGLDRREGGLAVGGALRPDAAHFFVAVDHRRETNEIVAAAPLDGGPSPSLVGLDGTRTRLLARIDGRLGGGGHLAGRFFLTDEGGGDGVGGLEPAENRRRTTTDDEAVVVTWTGLHGRATTHEVRASYARDRFEARAVAPPRGPVSIYPTRGVFGSPLPFETVEEDEWQLADRLSLATGAHAVKLGFGVSRLAATSGFALFPTGAYLFPPEATAPFDAGDPASRPILYLHGVPDPGAPPAAERTETYVDAFVQDDWRIHPRLALNLGLRWERQSTVPGRGNVAPRLGLLWNATGDGRTAVRAGYGLFYDRLVGRAETLERFWTAGGFGLVALAPEDPRFPVPPAAVAEPGTLPASRYVEAALAAPERRRSPSAQQLAFGLAREILPAFSVAVDVVHVRGRNLLRAVDLNAPAPFDYTTGETRTGDAADATRPFGVPGAPLAPGASGAAPGGVAFGGYRALYLLDARGASRYWAVRLDVTRRATGYLLVQAAYTWSRARDDGDGFRPERSLPALATRPELEWGRAATDTPHALAVNAVWEAPAGLRIAGVLRARSGRPIDPRAGVDRDGDLETRERPFAAGAILPRNGLRTAAFVGLDLAVAKSVELGEDRRLEVRLDVLNATNRLDPLAVVDTWGPDATRPLADFGRVVAAGPGRRVRIGLRLRF